MRSRRSFQGRRGPRCQCGGRLYPICIVRTALRRNCTTFGIYASNGRLMPARGARFAVTDGVASRCAVLAPVAFPLRLRSDARSIGNAEAQSGVSRFGANSSVLCALPRPSAGSLRCRKPFIMNPLRLVVVVSLPFVVLCALRVSVLTIITLFLIQRDQTRPLGNFGNLRSLGALRAQTGHTILENRV